MARNIYSRIRLSGTISNLTPMHVGGHGEEVDSDLPLARDGAGNLYVPGTSLAGALRDFTELLFPIEVDDLWGYQFNESGHASRIVVEDAVIEKSDEVVVEIRDHVGIDREFGSAAESIKYDRAILPRGTKLRFCLTVDVEEKANRNQALAVLAVLKQALEDGEIRLGAAKSRGLGYVKLVEGHLNEQIFGTRQGILVSLKNSSGVPISDNEIKGAKNEHPANKRPRLKMKIHWKPVGPLMVKAGFDGIAADMLPLVSGCNGGVSLVLPGSSIKGAFRSQAERIVRTIRGDTEPSWLKSDSRQKFLDAVEMELVNELFGQRAQNEMEEQGINAKNDPPQLRPGLGALSIMDCFGKRSISLDHWQAIQAAEDDKGLRNAMDNPNIKHWSQAYHVAIDRWLGSALDGALFSVLEPHDTEWEPLHLEINLQRLPDKLQLSCLALMLLVVRDLANDRIPLGFSTHRGMGSVSVEKIEIMGIEMPDSLKDLSKLTLHEGRLSGSTDLLNKLNEAWNQWAQYQEVPA